MDTWFRSCCEQLAALVGLAALSFVFTNTNPSAEIEGFCFADLGMMRDCAYFLVFFLALAPAFAANLLSSAFAVARWARA